MNDTGWLIRIALLWRVLLFFPLLIGYLYIPYRPGFEFTNIWGRVHPFFPVDHFLLFPWANFDGVNYLSISGNGYSLDGRFFPLFPLLISLISNIINSGSAFSLGQFFGGLIIANTASFFSLIIFYRLLRLDYSITFSRWVIVILLIFPSAFFFASIYSEGLFFLLLVSIFYLARRRKWFWATTLGAFLTATRPVGIFILPALVSELFIQEKRVELKKIFPLMLVPVGLVVYMLFSQVHWNNPWYFIQNQGDLANGRMTAGIVLFPQTVVRYLKILTAVPIWQYEWWIALLESGIFFVASLLLYRAWNMKVRGSYLVFSFLAFLLPASSGTFTGLPRYVIILFPLFIALASLPKRVIYIYLVCSPFLLFILLMLFARGYFVA